MDEIRSHAESFRLERSWPGLTESLSDEDAGTKKPDFVARRRGLLVRAFTELAGTLVVAELKVTSTHLVVEPGTL